MASHNQSFESGPLGTASEDALADAVARSDAKCSVPPDAIFTELVALGGGGWCFQRLGGAWFVGVSVSPLKPPYFVRTGGPGPWYRAAEGRWFTETESLVAAADASGPWYLCKENGWLKGTPATSAEAEEASFYALSVEYFNLLDVDESGVVELQQVRTIAAVLDLVPEDWLDAVTDGLIDDSMDTNQNGLISKAEFVSWIITQFTSHAHPEGLLTALRKEITRVKIHIQADRMPAAADGAAESKQEIDQAESSKQQTVQTHTIIKIPRGKKSGDCITGTHKGRAYSFKMPLGVQAGHKLKIPLPSSPQKAPRSSPRSSDVKSSGASASTAPLKSSVISASALDTATQAVPIMQSP